MKKNAHKVYFGVLTLFIMGFVLFMGVSNPKNVKAETYYYDSSINDYTYFYKISLSYLNDYGSLEQDGYYKILLYCYNEVQDDSNDHSEKYNIKFNGNGSDAYFYLDSSVISNGYQVYWEEQNSFFNSSGSIRLYSGTLLYIASNRGLGYQTSSIITKDAFFSAVYSKVNVTSGAIYTQQQYNDYGTSQYNSGRTQGQNDVKNNPNNYSLYTQSQYQANYNTGRTQGQNDVKNSPNDYNLYTTTQYNDYGSSQYNSGRTQGRTDVTTSPNSYSLFTQTQYNDYGTQRYNSGKSDGVTQGQNEVINSPSDFDLYTESEYTTYGENMYSSGQASVTLNPNTYSLYTQTQYNDYGSSQYNSGRTQGRTDVTTSPNSYSLYTQTQYQSNYTSGYNDGQDSILDNLSYYDLYTESEYTTYGENMYSSGQASVTSNPNSFNLYTEQQTESIRQHGYSSGVNEVRTNPNNYELYTEQQFIDYGEYQYETGYQGGYDNGFMDIDLTEAYQSGYEDGTQNEKLLNGSNTFFRNLFNQLGGLLQIEIFPDISIGFIILLPIILGLFAIVIKLLKG